mmetsp:Transcript_80656/g.127049  ORF Transcript_80656/g.127049 Transcript_80656/m.127049 type:complete len:836 (-) Transcript_80656:135-2642(-)
MREHQGSATERSNWGLFDRTVSVVKENGDTYKSLVYHCGSNRTVEFRQPLEGAGTTLMHGDFARKLSPSEEAMATYIIKHPRLFEGRRVLDVGAGLGFAGLVCATCTQPSSLELSDGDPEVVSTLRSSVDLNLANFGDAKVDVKKVLWDRTEDWSERDSIDVVIAADVVYLEFLHTALLNMVSRVLRPGGIFILFASRRNGSLQNFVNVAKAFFPTVETSTDYDADVEKSIGKHSKCFPVMVRLTAADIEADELPSSVAQVFEDLQKKRELMEKHARAEEKKKKRQEKICRARSEHLVNARLTRLQQKEIEEREERLLAEAEAAAKAAAEAEAAAKPRVPILSHAEQGGRSDWGLFARHCTASEDGSFKDMMYDVAGQSVSIRRPSNNTIHESRKVSASEEALAMWVAKHRKILKKKRVLVLGAGCGLAGFTAAVCTTAKHVVITDGDEGAVGMLKANADLNRDAFSAKKVSTHRLLLGGSADSLKRFDWVIAADVFDIDLDALLKTLRQFLKPSGKALMFAPVNRPSLKSFLCTAKLLFARIDVSREYDAEVTKALHGMSCFPMMVWLQRERRGSVHDVPRASSKQRASPELTISDICNEASTAVVHEASTDVHNNCRRKSNEAKPSLVRQRSRQKDRSVNAVAEGSQKSLSSEIDANTSEIETCDVVTPSESRLPDLTGSRCSSTKSSLAISEISSISLGPTRHVADNLTVAASGSPTRPSRNHEFAVAQRPRSTPGPTASTAVGCFWARLPDGGCSSDMFGGSAEGIVDKDHCWRKRSHSERRSKSEDCLFDLCVAGSGLAIQRCSGAETQGKLQRSRCLSRAPPRLPLARS